MSIALFIGRFQPLHLGHVKAIKYILEKEDRLILGIGSSQYHHTKENPFTAEERKRMIEWVFSDVLDRIEVVFVSDIHDESRWVNHVLSRVPSFNIVYTSSAVEERLFSAACFRVCVLPHFDRELYCGSDIRERMASKGRWRHLLPEGSIKVIEEIDGVKRIRKLS